MSINASIFKYMSMQEYLPTYSTNMYQRSLIPSIKLYSFRKTLQILFFKNKIINTARTNKTKYLNFN